MTDPITHLADEDAKWASAAVGIVGTDEPCERCDRLILAMQRHWVVRLGRQVQRRAVRGMTFQIHDPDVVLRLHLACGGELVQPPNPSYSIDHQPQLPPETQ